MPSVYQPKPCRRCGGAKDPTLPRHERSWYCRPCRSAVWEERGRAASWCGNCSAPWSCIACARAKRASQLAAARRGADKRRLSQPEYFRPESADRYWQSAAHAAVCRAIKRGVLPSLKGGDYQCTDCARPASEYDHRDYGRPLDVEPVCKSCNKLRGTAVWPTADRFDFKRFPAPTERAA